MLLRLVSELINATDWYILCYILIFQFLDVFLNLILTSLQKMYT